MPKKTAIGDFGLQAAQGALGAGLGLLLQKSQDKRQLAQQRKLQDLEIGGQKQMTDYNWNKQLEMWKATNFGAQMGELKKAGLNPGLIYGMGGAGGATTGSASGNVSGGHAPVGGGEAMGLAMAAAQMGLLRAQKENIEANTANTLGDAANKPKVGANIEASTASLTQGVQNAKAVEELTKIEQQLKKLDVDYSQQTLDDRVDTINTIANQAIEQLEILEQQKILDRSTRIQKAEIVKQQAVTAALQNGLIRAQKGNIEQQTQESKQKVEMMKAEMAKWAIELCQGWEGLDQNAKKIRIETLTKRMEEEKGYDWTGGTKRTYTKAIRQQIQELMQK